MSKMVLKAAYLALDSTDVSDHCSKIELSVEVEEKDVSTFASLGWKEVLGGLGSGSLAATFRQDVAAGEIDSILWPLFGTVVDFEVRLTQASVGTSNPKYSGQVLIKEHKPISGSVGDVAEVDVSYTTSGEVTRATS